MTTGTKWNDKHIAIIGAGFGGIVSALRLKRLGVTNFTIYEKANEVGGTWRDNSYPGCAVDVSTQWYSISSELNPNWSTPYAPRAEIWQYQKDVVDRNQLRPHLRLNSMIIGGAWDDARQGYELRIERTVTKEGVTGTTAISGTGEEETVFASVIIAATGGSWSVPQLPTSKDLPGIESFSGQVFHSASWRSDVDLRGKTVGVIGNGASATQIVPVISEDETTKVVNFCRSAQWFITRDESKYGSLRKWMNRYVPGFPRLVRILCYMKTDSQYVLMANSMSFLRPVLSWYFRQYMKSKAPKELVQELDPKIQIGCRRVIRDPNYYSSLHRPNVSLEWSPITEVTPTGILTSTANGSKHIPLDVIVTAIGFQTSASIALPIQGREGLTMKEYWEKSGGPTAYKGTTMPGFPNMFLLLGPNSGAGHASVLFYEECQVDYTMKMIKPILDKKSTTTSVEVTSEACDAYNNKIQRKLENSVWATCTSYYNQHGKKNVSLFPGFATAFWWQIAWPVWSHYTVK